MRTLHSSPHREAILVPSMFNPPIMLSNIFRIGGFLKAKGLTSAPNRRMGGWHLKLTDSGVSFCEATPESKQQISGISGKASTNTPQIQPLK